MTSIAPRAPVVLEGASRVRFRPRAFFVGAFFVGLLFLLAAFSPPSSADSLSDYQARLADWEQAITRIRQQAATGDETWRENLREVAIDVGRTRTVHRPTAGSVSMEHPRLEAALAEAMEARKGEDRAAALSAAEEQLASYRKALSPLPAVDRDHVRQVLARVLPAAPSTDARHPHWLKGLVQRLFDWLGRLFERLPELPGPAPRALFWVVVGVGAAILAIVLWLALRSLLQRFTRQAAAYGKIEISRPPEAPDADAVLSEARQAAAAGAYRDAIRRLYLALLLKLDSAGLLSYHPAKTNWEHLRSFGDEGLRPTFTSFTSIFDHTWYGAKSAARSDYEQCEALFREALAQAETT